MRLVSLCLFLVAVIAMRDQKIRLPVNLRPRYLKITNIAQNRFSILCFVVDLLALNVMKSPRVAVL